MILTPLRRSIDSASAPRPAVWSMTWVRGPGALGAKVLGTRVLGRGALASFEISAIGCGAVALLREASVSRGGVSRGAVPGAANPIPARSSGVASQPSPGEKAPMAPRAPRVPTAQSRPRPRLQPGCNCQATDALEPGIAAGARSNRRLSCPSFTLPGGACPNRRKIQDIRPAAEGHVAAPVRQEPEAVRRTPRSAAYIPGRAGQNRSMAH